MIIIHALCTYNNTILTVTDKSGKTIFWSSAGLNKFRGTKKSTSFAAQKTTEIVCKKIISLGHKKVFIRLKGPGIGREHVLRTIANSDLDIKIIEDVTPIPHNGCRPKKPRRT
ncbi:SSU ribosomal protein S11p (S14e) [Candidatus Vidania fulgoroideae]|nr:SSU ribosomal protein S11p (S14e) [Candidatus Vidania fulgoroideae]